MIVYENVVTKTGELDGKMKLLEALKTKINEQKRIYEKLHNKFNKRKRKFDEISEAVTQACDDNLVPGTPLKEEMLLIS